MSYRTSASGIYVNLGSGRGYTGEAYGDRLVSIENLEGSNFNDILKGDNNANVLSGLDGDDQILGYGGDDTIKGGDGNDQILGDRGNDILMGGLGQDSLRDGIGENVFVLSVAHATDTITDFSRSNNAIALLDNLSSTEVELTKVGVNSQLVFNGTVLANLLRVSSPTVKFVNLNQNPLLISQLPSTMINGQLSPFLASFSSNRNKRNR